MSTHKLVANEYDKIKVLYNPSAEFYGINDLFNFITTDQEGIYFAENNGIFADSSFYNNGLF